MIPIATGARVRDAETRWFAAHPGGDLMGGAAAAVVRAAVEMLPRQPSLCQVLIAVGPGNNGGDGLFAAAGLAAAGAQVTVWCTSDAVHLAGWSAAAAECRFVDAIQALEALPDADLVIDAVLGIGGRPGLPVDVATFAAAVGDCGIDVLAVDIPSGLDADSPNRPLPASFTATRTLTFASAKLAHHAQPAAGRCGVVEVVDIGIDLGDEGVRVITPADVARLWPRPNALSDKYSRGVVGVDAGSPAYTGAAVLATFGAVYSGAGMVRFVGPDEAATLVRQAMPSVVVGSGQVQAWVCGSGWGPSVVNGERLAARLADHRPVVVDADALRRLPTDLPSGSLLTPHAGELAWLLKVERAAVEADPLGHARRAAARFSASVLLKGATQYAVHPDGSAYLAVAGPAWTAQAGSGDVVAGICATLLASGVEASLAGGLAASAQAMTALAHPGPWPADAIARLLPGVIGSLAAPQA
ncbi:MAG TPA: NAD(P)H-hydrate dehydratase [Propionibacteriaceae bacterium]|nr:NAD(P)H-hydrate dehydratase [Propionibacteriaceae bacterium]